jgi:hypothetical protein
VDQLRTYEKGVSTEPTQVYLQKRLKKGAHSQNPNGTYYSNNYSTLSIKNKAELNLMKKDNLMTCNGFITNQKTIKEQRDTFFKQAVHSDILSQSKRVNQKYVNTKGQSEFSGSRSPPRNTLIMK